MQDSLPVQKVQFENKIRAIIQKNNQMLIQNKMTIKVWVGGGLGRTPVIGSVIHNNLEWEHILTYCEAILLIYFLIFRHDHTGSVYFAIQYHMNSNCSRK